MVELVSASKYQHVVIIDLKLCIVWVIVLPKQLSHVKLMWESMNHKCSVAYISQLSFYSSCMCITTTTTTTIASKIC